MNEKKKLELGTEEVCSAYDRAVNEFDEQPIPASDPKPPESPQSVFQSYPDIFQRVLKVLESEDTDYQNVDWDHIIDDGPEENISPDDRKKLKNACNSALLQFAIFRDINTGKEPDKEWIMGLIDSQAVAEEWDENMISLKKAEVIKLINHLTRSRDNKIRKRVATKTSRTNAEVNRKNKRRTKNKMAKKSRQKKRR